MTEIATSTLQVIDREGVKHQISWNPGQSLMEAIRDSGLPIPALCGGNCVCATCHVYVDKRTLPALNARSEEEVELLQGASGFDPCTSRLACQIRHSTALVATKVELAPYD